MAARAVAVRKGARRATALSDDLARVHGVRAGAADVSVALVHAVQPSVLGLLPLSLVDTELIYDAGPLSWTWFYEAALDADVLAASLARALVCYPLFAGRLVRLPRDAHGRRRVAVACDNQGALFSRVRAPAGVPLPRRRGETPGQLPPWAAGWAGPPSLAALLDDPHAPLLEAVLVNYAEGGCSLTVKTTHGLADGQSLAMFVACWSRCFAQPNAPQPWPLLDRGVQDEHMTVGDGDAAAAALDSAAAAAGCGCAAAPRSAAMSPSGVIKDVLSPGALAKLGVRAVFDPSMGFHLHTRAVVGACFHISSAQLASIKLAASSKARRDAGLVPAEAVCDAPPDSTKLLEPSTFDALTALLWRSVFRAKQRRGLLDRSHAAPPSLFFPANIRARLEPPLPPSFVGNATMGIVVQLADATLRGGCLSAVASAIQQRKQAAVAPASIRAQLAYLDAETRRGRKKRWNVNPLDNVVLLSDWRFPDAPLYGAAAFGNATPFWFEPGLDVGMRFPYVGCLLQSPPRRGMDGGVTILMNLPADELEEVARAMQDEASW